MNFRTESLADVCELIVDCPHSTPEWTTSGYLVIRNQNIRDGRLDLSERSFTNREDYLHRVRRAKPRGGDIIFTREAPMGEVCVVPNGLECCVGQRQVLLRPRADMAARYLFYALRSPFVRHQIFWNEGTGSTVSNVRIPVLKALRIPRMDELEEAVGNVLGSIDDKIELNRQIIETLEAMAQAIFRDWFVDFGPVRRKLAGETDPVAIMGGLTPDPVRAAELAALFPAVLAEGGLPEGWTDCPIGDRVEIAGGSTPSTADDNLWNPAEHRWATPKDLSNMSDLALFETGRRISSAGLAKITSGLLPPGTVLLSSRAPIGYLAIAQEPVAINQGFIALKPTTDHGSAYLYLWCKANMEAILANANGSTFQEISKKNFRPISSATPADPAILHAFGDIAQPLIDRIVSAARENRTLAETRDYLLPRLMSGEVRVAPAEAMT